MNKVTYRGTRLIVIAEDAKTAQLWEVEDCQKQLKDWKPTRLIETVNIPETAKAHMLKLWESTGKVEMEVNA